MFDIVMGYNCFMKKVMITGASSGIGLEIKKQLNDDSIIDFSFPEFDLRKTDDVSKVIGTINKEKPSLLFLNAGVFLDGTFDKHNYKDIEDLLKVNLLSNIRILNEIMPLIINKDIKVVVTLSTASYINGAYESIYNMSKKALKELIVSINTELEYKGIDNKIFMFVPHFIEGTGMTSKENKPSDILTNMINDLLKAIKDNKNQFVANGSFYKTIFKKYQEDPIKQGLESIAYKKEKGKLNE